MADNAPTGRSFTEGEAYALVADNVARETASRDTQIASLTQEKSELTTKIDTLETEKAAAEQRATAAEEAFAAYKAEQENARQVAERAETRKAELATANPFLELTDDRVKRVAAMSDDDYAVYLGEMREVAEKVKATTTTKTADEVKPDDKPAADETRNTAAFKPGGDTDTKPAGTVMGVFRARAGVSQTA